MVLGGAGEAGNGGADQRDLDDVVAAAHRGRAVPLAHLHLHVGDHHALGAEPSDVILQAASGVVPRPVNQLGPAGHLGIARPPASLAGSRPVIVPRPDRDAERQPDRYPARHDQRGEILPGQIRGKRRPRPGRGASYAYRPGASRAYRGTDGAELQPAQGERPPVQPDTHHSVPAKRGTLSSHPVDGRLPGLVHRLHQRPERPRITCPGHPGSRPRRHPVARCSPCPRTAIPAGGPRGVDGRAEHLAHGREASATDGGELLTGQRGLPRVAGPACRHPGPGCGGQFLVHAIRRSGRKRLHLSCPETGRRRPGWAPGPGTPAG
jgi:hypothetical protein